MQIGVSGQRKIQDVQRVTINLAVTKPIPADESPDKVHENIPEETALHQIAQTFPKKGSSSAGTFVFKDSKSFGQVLDPFQPSSAFTTALIETAESDITLFVPTSQQERKSSIADGEEEESCEEIKEEEDNRCYINKKLIKK